MVSAVIWMLQSCSRLCGCTAAEGGDDTAISILERGEHRLPFDFALPEQCLPCSFESRVGTVRYYLRVIIDIPYASPPQGLKYFTVIGPHIDCNDDKYAVRGFLRRFTSQHALSALFALRKILSRSLPCFALLLRVVSF